MQRRIEGSVLLGVIVERDGSVGDVQVAQSLDPDHGLDKEAIAAARQWRFTPPTRGGVPVRMIVTLELAFTLK